MSLVTSLSSYNSGLPARRTWKRRGSTQPQRAQDLCVASRPHPHIYGMLTDIRRSIRPRWVVCLEGSSAGPARVRKHPPSPMRGTPTVRQLYVVLLVVLSPVQTCHQDAERDVPGHWPLQACEGRRLPGQSSPQALPIRTSSPSFDAFTKGPVPYRTEIIRPGAPSWDCSANSNAYPSLGLSNQTPPYPPTTQYQPPGGGSRRVRRHLR